MCKPYERIYNQRMFKIDLGTSYLNNNDYIITAITQNSIDDGMVLFLMAHSIGRNCSQFKNKILVKISIYLVQFIRTTTVKLLQ